MLPQDHILSLLDFLKVRQDGSSSVNQFPSSAEEWQDWYICAVNQGVAPLLYFRIVQLKIKDKIPSDILSQLQENYHQNAARNLLLLNKLMQIIERLNANSIQVLVLKGGFLAPIVYSSPALRIMSDLDILVPPSKIENVLQILYELGYYRLYPPWEETDYNITLELKESPVLLEVHWELSSIPNDRMIPIADIWQHTSPQEYMEQKISAMDPTDLLIHLCQHTAIMHMFALGLRLLCDIDALIRKYSDELDWETIASRSKEWGAQRAVSLTICLCWQYLETPLPEAAIKILALRQIDSNILREAIIQISFAKDEPNNIINPDITRFLKRLLSEKTPIRMAIFFFESLRRPSHLSAAGYSESSNLYFYFRRFLYLTKKYTGAIVNYLKRDSNTAQEIIRQKELLRWLRT
jgi:hypothetical protein